MQYKISIKCPQCGMSEIMVPCKKGSEHELVLRIEFLEQQLHKLMKSNMSLRQTLSRLIK